MRECRYSYETSMSTAHNPSFPREAGAASPSPAAKPIPRVGDEWEFALPNKSKKRKIIASISYEWHRGKWDDDTCKYSMSRHPRVNWQRRNKGRYSSLRVKWLMKYGRRISTKAERDAKFEARMKHLDDQLAATARGDGRKHESV